MTLSLAIRRCPLLRELLTTDTLRGGRSVALSAPRQPKCPIRLADLGVLREYQSTATNRTLCLISARVKPPTRLCLMEVKCRLTWQQSPRLGALIACQGSQSLARRARGCGRAMRDHAGSFMSPPMMSTVGRPVVGEAFARRFGHSTRPCATSRAPYEGHPIRDLDQSRFPLAGNRLDMATAYPIVASTLATMDAGVALGRSARRTSSHPARR